MPALTAKSTDEAAWLAERADRVTASEIHAIATGSKRTWLRILDDKLNGSLFQGNRHTRRGHEREAFLIAAAEEWTGTPIAPQEHALWRARDRDAFAATPDGVSFAPAFGVEVKSRDHGADLTTIPPAHYDQMQWGMRVTGFPRWLYAAEAMGEDGEPTLDEPVFVWIDRNEVRIVELEQFAEAFIAWREAGAPVADDDLPDGFEDVVGPWLRDCATRDAATKAAKAREPLVRKLIADRGAEVNGWKPMSDVGGFTYSTSTKTVLNEAAWAAAEPEKHAEVAAMKAAIAETEEAALHLYPKTTRTSRLLPVQPKGA